MAQRYMQRGCSGSLSEEETLELTPGGWGWAGVQTAGKGLSGRKAIPRVWRWKGLSALEGEKGGQRGWSRVSEGAMSEDRGIGLARSCRGTILWVWNLDFTLRAVRLRERFVVGEWCAPMRLSSVGMGKGKGLPIYLKENFSGVDEESADDVIELSSQTWVEPFIIFNSGQGTYFLLPSVSSFVIGRSQSL